jgi:hypothetical protein
MLQLFANREITNIVSSDAAVETRNAQSHRATGTRRVIESRHRCTPGRLYRQRKSSRVPREKKVSQSTETPHETVSSSRSGISISAKGAGRTSQDGLTCAWN